MCIRDRIPFIPGGALYYAVSAALRMDLPVFAEKARSALGLAVALAAGKMCIRDSLQNITTDSRSGNL